MMNAGLVWIDDRQIDLGFFQFVCFCAAEFLVYKKLLNWSIFLQTIANAFVPQGKQYSIGSFKVKLNFFRVFSKWFCKNKVYWLCHKTQFYQKIILYKEVSDVSPLIWQLILLLSTTTKQQPLYSSSNKHNILSVSIQ